MKYTQPQVKRVFPRRPRKRVHPNQAVKIDADILGGTPVFVNTRVPVTALFDYLEDNQTLIEFLEDFPSVKQEVVVAFLAELAQQYKTEAK
jgi:uncharacterized protein (DUF433 family)